MRKKIIHLSLSTGGVKTYVAHVLQYANSNEFEFVVIAPRDQLFEDFCQLQNSPYYQVDLNRGLNPFKLLKNLWQIYRIIKKEHPALLHAHSAMGGFLGRLAGRLTGTKVIYTPHAFSYLSFIGAKRAIFYLLECLARRWANLLLAISYSEANIAIHELGYPQHKVKVVLNAIPITNQRVTAVQNGQLNVNMIGRFTHQKNPMQFVEIAQRLSKIYPDVRFNILGAGIHDELKQEVESYVNQCSLTNHLNIRAWGDVCTSENFLLETAIYVSTSIFEGLPFSLLEAMLYSIPCVVSKVPGNIDVINNGENGYTCLSTEEFCTRISALINDQNLRTAIGKAGQQYVIITHNIVNAMQQLEKTYLAI